MNRLHLSAALLCLFTLSASAQNPTKWAFNATDAGNCQADLVLTGTLEEGWCTYSQFLESEDGPVATSLTFNQGEHFKLIGKAVESGEIVKTHDPVFLMTLTKFKHKAIFTQKIEVLDPSKPITGYITYMVCNDEMCLPPREVPFSFTVPALKGCNTKH
ncbi:MAG TPA: protein-disulfide reductase DsbD domain-containing protein [Saprospiraceae bacterium]|nr:protein-disulfide reductase DsbD domain-containing protein [Saprospiraceae bacterium]